MARPRVRRCNPFLDAPTCCPSGCWAPTGILGSAGITDMQISYPPDTLVTAALQRTPISFWDVRSTPDACACRWWLERILSLDQASTGVSACYTSHCKKYPIKVIFCAVGDCIALCGAMSGFVIECSDCAPPSTVHRACPSLDRTSTMAFASAAT